MFSLQPHLDRQYHATPHKFALTATNTAELTTWQAQFRGELAQLLGIAGRQLPAVPSVELLTTQDKETYTEEKYALQLGDVFIPLYLLIPKTPPPYKAILAFHGHAPSIQPMLGNVPTTHDDNYAQRLVQAGYLVCAIEQRGFGERITQQVSPHENKHSCRHLAFEYLLQGTTLLGERVWDALGTLQYLQTRPDIRQDQFGCTGHSGGATTALFLAALDPRISVTVVAGYFCAYKHSILGMPHCECNYVPHLLTLGDIGELTALLAPRPLRIIHGERDPIFPLEGVHAPYQVVKQAYSLAQQDHACSLFLHPDEHQYHFPAALAWFQQWL